MRKPSHFLILVLALGVINFHAWGGTQNATITGAVYERSSGAVVPGATVRLINASIGFSQVQVTGPEGTYTFDNVPPAENYVISVERSGFSPAVLTNIIVLVDEEKLVLPPFRLEAPVQANPPVSSQTPSQAPTQAPTAAAAPARQKSEKAPSVSLDLLSTTQSGVIESRWVHTLPLVNRDFIDLALLVPGTYPVEQGSVLQGASLAVNGARADMNNFLLDGADNNDYTINQSLPFQIVEAMQEFRVQTSTENAEFGRSGGAQINVVSRSGSNAIHGGLFEFNRNSALSARNFFSGYSGGTFNQYAREIQVSVPGHPNPLTDPTLAALYNVHNPLVNQNQFGGSIGGALIKDKLLGFFNWESLRLVNPLPLFEQVPGTTFRSMDTCASFEGSPCDGTAVKLYNLYPAPNVIPASGSTATRFVNPAGFGPPDPATNPLGLPVGSGAFAVGQAANHTDSDNFLGRIDWRIGSRIGMSFKYNIQRINQLQGGNVPTTTAYPGNGTRVNGRNQNFSYNYVQQLTSRMTNEFRFGWNRFRLTTVAQDAGFDPTTLGLQNLTTNQGLPTVIVGGVFGSFAPFSTLGANQAAPSNRADNVWSYEDNLSLNHGRHTWKFGATYRHIRLNVNNDALGRGVLGFFSGESVAASGMPDIGSIARVCPESLPSFSAVFAQPCAQFGSGFDRSFSTNSVDWYVQDQWRPWHNFTLNYGIRYEVNTAPVERRNRLVNFYPNLGTQGALVRGGSTTEFDPFGNVIGTASKAAPRAGYETDYNNWGPRFGFAWDPWSDGQTVVRGGYALMFDQQSLEPSVNMLLNPPFIQQSFSFFPGFTLSDTFSVCPSIKTDTGCLSASPNATSDWALFPYSVTAIDQHNKTPYIHQFHFGIQQQLGGKAVFEASYVGSAGHRLPQLAALSECTLAQFFSTSSVNSNACFNFVQSPFLFTGIVNQQNTADSNFHSLQVRFDTREFHGLQLRGFYQLAKSIDDASSVQPQVFLLSPLVADFLVSLSALNPEEVAGANNLSPTLSLQGNLPVITTRPRLPQDSSNLAGERGLSDFSIHHRGVIDYIYSVPRWAPRIGTGWQLAGITTFQSGQPFSVYTDVLGAPLRPSVTGPVHINVYNPQAAISVSGFNFSPTTLLQPGNLGRNTFIGPKYINFDFAVLKDTHLGKSERANLQFKVEFFNLFNNVNFRLPYSRVGEFFADPTGNFTANLPPGSRNCFPASNGVQSCSSLDPFFGQILQAFPARQIQFALKLSF